MNPNNMPDIMILAQAVLQILCWQDCFATQMPKSKKGDNSAKYLQNLAKRNQIIYTLDTICEPNSQISFDIPTRDNIHRCQCI